MKKIMKRKGTDVESYISGYSLEYGILLRAQTTGNDGINFFENMYPGAFATIDDSGNVKIMHEEQFKLSDKQKEKELKDKKAIKRLENALFFAGVIFLLLVIPAVMLSSNIGIFCVGMSFICFGLKNVAMKRNENYSIDNIDTNIDSLINKIIEFENTFKDCIVDENTSNDMYITMSNFVKLHKTRTTSKSERTTRVGILNDFIVGE